MMEQPDAVEQSTEVRFPVENEGCVIQPGMVWRDIWLEVMRFTPSIMSISPVFIVVILFIF